MYVICDVGKQMIHFTLFAFFTLVNLYIQKVLRRGRKLFGTPFDRHPPVYETIQVSVLNLSVRSSLTYEYLFSLCE